MNADPRPITSAPLARWVDGKGWQFLRLGSLLEGQPVYEDDAVLSTAIEPGKVIQLDMFERAA